MRILRVIASMDPVSGGPCEGIRNSIPTMAEMGVLNEVVSLDDPDADFIKTEIFRIYGLGPAKGPYAYCKKLSNWLESNLTTYDVVIIHGLWLYNSYGTMRVWKNLKKKTERLPALYVMPHGMLDPYFQKSKERRLKAIRNFIFWELFEKKVISSADGLLFTCQQELLLGRRTFASYYPKEEHNVGYGILPPPDNNTAFSKAFYQKCPEVEKRPYWLFLGRLHSKKGVDNLIKAYVTLKKVKKDLPNLVIAGPGLETTYGDKLLELAKGYSIYFIGMLTGSAKWGAFYNASAFVLPSHQENFGIAVVEALACGKPVLISNKVNICEEIQSVQAGIVKNDTYLDTYFMLEEFYALKPEQQLQMGKNARELFLKKFHIKEATKQMLQVFNQPTKILNFAQSL